MFVLVVHCVGCVLSVLLFRCCVNRNGVLFACMYPVVVLSFCGVIVLLGFEVLWYSISVVAGNYVLVVLRVLVLYCGSA